ncbi:MAG: hypothetical protein ACOX56_04185 [Acholeplasmataceae bacterium]|jgi:predicted membrane protein
MSEELTNNEEYLDKEPVQETKFEKFTVFLQVLMGICFLLGVLVSISPYLKSIMFGLALILLLLITIITLGALLFVDEFRDIWKFVINHGELSEGFFNIGYYLYGVSIGIGIIVVLYFLISKKVDKKKQKIIYPLVVIGLAIFGLVLHQVVYNDYFVTN